MVDRTNVGVRAILAVAMISWRASASPTFPGEIERHLGAAATPPCKTCHEGNPGVGTATTPFATAMKQRGLVGNDTGSLDNALDALDGEMTDTDGDGVPDIEELRRGWDPNVPNFADGGIDTKAARPRSLATWYGCAVRPESAPVASDRVGSLLVVLMALLRRGMLARKRGHR